MILHKTKEQTDITLTEYFANKNQFTFEIETKLHSYRRLSAGINSSSMHNSQNCQCLFTLTKADTVDSGSHSARPAHVLIITSSQQHVSASTNTHLTRRYQNKQ